MEHLLEDTRSLGALVRARRRALGLRQSDLAFSANVGVRFIVDLENGKDGCQIGLALKLLTVLGIRVTASCPETSDMAPVMDMQGIDP